MAYDVNTSIKCRLPHNFFWDWYSVISDIEDIVSDHHGPKTEYTTEDVVKVLEHTLQQLKRLRQSHRGCEDL